jgi:7-cyano-7-deazaguanine synthase
MLKNERSKERPEKAWVLMSGGIDSTACACMLNAGGWEVEGIFVDYGQPALVQEHKAVNAVSSRLSIPVRSVTVGLTHIHSDGEVTGRNAMLVSVAFVEIGRQAGLLAVGLHSGTPYYDCGPGFINSLQQIADGYTGGVLRIHAPFINWTKDEIWGYCHEHSVPLGLTYSCELGLEHPCGRCRSCKDLEALYAL